jgi:hypothetical protein
LYADVSDSKSTEILIEIVVSFYAGVSDSKSTEISRRSCMQNTTSEIIRKIMASYVF